MDGGALPVVPPYPNHIAVRDMHTFAKPGRIMIQMRIVVAVGLRLVELVDR